VTGSTSGDAGHGLAVAGRVGAGVAGAAVGVGAALEGVVALVAAEAVVAVAAFDHVVAAAVEVVVATVTRVMTMRRLICRCFMFSEL
jgi:hypothetical protein